jgi:hypothetical protein
LIKDSKSEAMSLEVLELSKLEALELDSLIPTATKQLASNSK